MRPQLFEPGDFGSLGVKFPAGDSKRCSGSKKLGTSSSPNAVPKRAARACRQAEPCSSLSCPGSVLPRIKGLELVMKEKAKPDKTEKGLQNRSRRRQPAPKQSKQMPFSSLRERYPKRSMAQAYRKAFVEVLHEDLTEALEAYCTDKETRTIVHSVLAAVFKIVDKDQEFDFCEAIAAVGLLLHRIHSTWDSEQHDKS
jgi:hypothetical protein